MEVVTRKATTTACTGDNNRGVIHIPEAGINGIHSSGKCVVQGTDALTRGKVKALRAKMGNMRTAEITRRVSVRDRTLETTRSSQYFKVIVEQGPRRNYSEVPNATKRRNTGNKTQTDAHTRFQPVWNSNFTPPDDLQEILHAIGHEGWRICDKLFAGQSLKRWFSQGKVEGGRKDIRIGTGEQERRQHYYSGGGN